MRARTRPARKRQSVLGERLKDLGFLTYDDYLVSDLWIARRTSYYTQGGAKTCFVCNEGAWLNVHHLTYRNLGHEKAEDLVTLCRGCHQGVHEFMKSHHGFVPLDEAHIRFKQSRADKIFKKQKPFVPAGDAKTRRARREAAKGHQWRRNESERRAETRTKREIKAREKARTEHEFAETRRLRQESIRKTREVLGRPLTYAEAQAIIDLNIAP